MRRVQRRQLLVVSAWYPDDRWPWRGVFVREQVRALAAAGHEVTVMVPERAGYAKAVIGDARIDEESGVTILRCATRWAGLRGASTAAMAVTLRVALARLLRYGRRPEIIHAHVFSAGALAVPLAHAVGAPLVVSEHYSGIARGTVSDWDALVARWTYGRADLVTPVSHDLRARIEGRGWGRHFEVVPNGVDTTIFRPGPAHPQRDEPRLLLVGGLTPVKGVPVALAAVAGAPRRIRLDVVGDGPARVEYEALSQALEVDDRVHFHGDQPREHVAELMRAADLYLLTSEWENLPTVVLESLCTGLPVVASDVGGVAEAVGPDDGLLVERGNPGLFSIAIDTALRRAWDRAAIARRAAARFGLDRIRARWEDIYWRLITQRRRGARS